MAFCYQAVGGFEAPRTNLIRSDRRVKAVEERVIDIPIPVVLFVHLFLDHFWPPNLPTIPVVIGMCVESPKPRILYKRQFKLAGGAPALWGGAHPGGARGQGLRP